MTKAVLLFFGLVLSFFSVSSFALDSDRLSEINKELGKIDKDLKVTEFRDSKFPGYDEALIDNQVLFISKDNKYVILGRIIDMNNPSLEDTVGIDYANDNRLKLLAKVDGDTFIKFSPSKPDNIKAKIIVFTDVNCYYCRKLHSEINQLTENGIEVSYVSFPLGGHGSASHRKAISVWCSEDQQTALTAAKRGEDVGNKSCLNPVEQHTSAGRKLRVMATPTIILEDGHVISGYMPANDLTEIAIKHSKGGSNESSGS